MADGLSGTGRRWWWTDLFRTAQVALDKKLLLAAAGIVLMWVGWWFWSAAVASMRSAPTPPSAEAAQNNPQLEKTYLRDREQYMFFHALAGAPRTDTAEPWERQPGIFRVRPWNEDRGPNPFLLVTGSYREGGVHGPLYQPGRFWEWVVTEQAPVLLEPLVKFLKPVILLLNPRADFVTRIYLLVGTLWTLAVWALFGGAITRIAVLQLAGKDAGSMRDALRFAMNRYVHYLSAPLVPLVMVAGITIIIMIFGLIHLIPILGDLVDGVLWIVPMLLGLAQALLLVGLVGYPLMYPTISAEGSDTFDALSRSYNYVYQSPWAYVWSGIVAIAYGMVVVFFVAFMGSLVVYLTKWSLGQTPGTEYYSSRRVDHLFVYAPATYEWHDLLVDRPELKTYATPAERTTYLNEHTYWWNRASAYLVGLWLKLAVLLIVGFGYSYFFTAGTMIYLLMRQRVDDTETDEVYTDEDFPDEPLMPPPSAPSATMSNGPQTQMVDAPTLRTPTPASPETTEYKPGG